MESFVSIPNLKVLESEITEKKSRFLAFAKYVTTSEDAELFYRQKRKEFSDAKHVVFAYRLINVSRASDDGEPSGTAGKPILDVIQKLGLYNVIVVVVRYFGGVKLGAGPLLRVYSKSASEVLKKPYRLYEKCLKSSVRVEFSQFQSLLKLASENKIMLENIEYSEKVALDIIAPAYEKFNYDVISRQEIFYSFKEA